MAKMELVNVVATGDLNRELDLDGLYQDLDLMVVDYSPETFPGIKIQISSEGATILLFKSGKFTVTGGSSQNEIRQATDSLRDRLSELGILDINENLQTKIVNLVYSGEIELNISLELLLTVLGFDNTEYEPEISPFVVYRPKNIDCVITISGSGKVVITGTTEERVAKSGLNEIERQIKKLE